MMFTAVQRRRIATPASHRTQEVAYYKRDVLRVRVACGRPGSRRPPRPPGPARASTAARPRAASGIGPSGPASGQDQPNHLRATAGGALDQRKETSHGRLGHGSQTWRSDGRKDAGDGGTRQEIGHPSSEVLVAAAELPVLCDGEPLTGVTRPGRVATRGVAWTRTDRCGGRDRGGLYRFALGHHGHRGAP
jgi:hypothetical protein